MNIVNRVVSGCRCFLCLAFLAFFVACDPITVVVGGAAIAGVEATRNQEGVSGAISDLEIQTKINKVLFDNDKDIFDRVELCIKHSVVIVIGYMRDQQQCEKAMQLVKSVDGCRAIFDETRVGDPPDAKNLAVDSSITSRIKSSLTFDGNIQSLNYDITTVKGIVYICGTAQSKFERDVVLNCTRTTSGVEKVVAYISVNKDTANKNTTNKN
jgi:osmotically-inducible protein OsmY